MADLIELANLDRANVKIELMKKQFPTTETVVGEQQQQRHQPAANLQLDYKVSRAIKQDDIDDFVHQLEQVVSSGNNLSLSDILQQVTPAGNSCLHVAARYQSVNVAQLIAHQCPSLLKKTNIIGDTPLHVAAKTKIHTHRDNGKTNIVDVILRNYKKHYGAATTFLEMVNEYGNTPLHEAVLHRLGHAHSDHHQSIYHKVTTIIFEEDKRVAYFPNKEGKSPLYLAAEDWNVELVELLLQAPFQRDKERQVQGLSPLHAVILEKTPHALRKKLLWNTPSHLYYYWMILLQNIGDSKPLIETMKLILEKGPAELITLRDEEGNTPLHFAAFTGDVDAVSMLLDKCDQCALERNNKGQLPIHVACENNCLNVVIRMLVRQEAQDPIDLLNKEGQNILHVATKNGKDKVVKYILRNQNLEALLNDQDINGNTPLHLAAQNLHLDVLLSLTDERRINVKLTNNKGMTARDVALLCLKTPTLRQKMSVSILRSAGTPESPKVKKITKNQPHDTKWIKNRIDTLMLVTILVATVTFAAGFTVPGSVNSSDDKEHPRGLATLVNRKMFQVFTICNTVAMYSSTVGSFILLWAQFGNDYNIAKSAFTAGLCFTGLALVTMSVAFMAAVRLVVSNLVWLGNVVLIIGTFFLLIFMIAYILYIYPYGLRIPLMHTLSVSLIRILLPFFGSETIEREQGMLEEGDKTLVEVRVHDKKSVEVQVHDKKSLEVKVQETV
ncbi:Protein ACCELERATED CELL DEATH 6 [Quillaja saponaria]|uniref:Protein ACCELERATED CELL DEATH 6 n=1 Tax=Quillaja saponaria TaxID=32244 RepID=A0AAD7QH61_QUISA|nr:Protein ACCELERATED CELL DEATH 6 [Quillaja saponaria]